MTLLKIHLGDIILIVLCALLAKLVTHVFDHVYSTECARVAVYFSSLGYMILSHCEVCRILSTFVLY